MAALALRSPYCSPVTALARTTPAASKRNSKPTTLTPPPSPSTSKKKVRLPQTPKFSLRLPKPNPWISACTQVLVPVGFGSEEMEAVILVDVLRRAGAEVLLASVEPQLEIRASLGTKIVADDSISSCSNEIFDLVALPGGMPGSTRLRDCEVLRTIMSKQVEEKRLYGAICAAPAVVLHPWGLMRRKQMTGHPAFMDKLPTFWAVTSNLQVSGELTTSRGPGTSFEFALSFVEQMFGSSLAEEIGANLVLVPIANGSEEMEVVMMVDILRRAKVDVVVASVEKSMQILGSQETKLVADKSIDDAAESIFDAIILPLILEGEFAIFEPLMNTKPLLRKSVTGSSRGNNFLLRKELNAPGCPFTLNLQPAQPLPFSLHHHTLNLQPAQPRPLSLSLGGVVGSERLHKSKVLKKLLKEQESAGRIYGGICSSPSILQKQGLLKGKRATAHPSVIKKITGQVAEGAGVVIDGRVITSKGLGSVMDFALAIVNKLFGHARARSVAEGLVFDYSRS
ncbi:hypothetical protein ACLOJK_013758 [Asimina triloba]